MYDYVIIGAGVIGSFIAQELSKYNVKVVVIEKENDIANGTSAANSAIIHSGYDPKPNTLKAILNVEGNKMYPKICEYYNVPYNNIGSLTIAFDEVGLKKLKELQLNAQANGVEVVMLSKEEIIAKEPNLNENVQQALYAPTAAIVYPWQISFALMDHAITNGVILKLNETVLDIKKESNYIIKTNKNIYHTNNIINCAGLYATSIQSMLEEVSINVRPRKGEYYVINRKNYQYVNHIIFPIPTDKGKGILANPISENEILIGPTSNFVDDLDDVSTTKQQLDYIKSEILNTMKDFPIHRVMRSFAGLRATSDNHDFNIEESKKNKGLFNLIGIESPGLASAPAITKYLSEIADFKNLKANERFKQYQPTTRINHLCSEKRAMLIKTNEDYGRIICRCEGISKQEVLESIRGNVGANSIKGVKKRVRPGSGVCQGGFCEPEILKMIAQEKELSVSEVLYDKLGSNIVVAMAKEVTSDEKL